MTSKLRVLEIEKIGKHLGIPYDQGASKKQIFVWILARVNMKLEGQKEKAMFKA